MGLCDMGGGARDERGTWTSWLEASWGDVMDAKGMGKMQREQGRGGNLGSGERRAPIGWGGECWLNDEMVVLEAFEIRLTSL